MLRLVEIIKVQFNSKKHLSRWFLLNCTALVQLLALLASQQYVVSLELYSSCTAVGFVSQSAVRWFLLNCTALVQLLVLLSSQQYGGFS